MDSRLTKYWLILLSLLFTSPLYAGTGTYYIGVDTTLLSANIKWDTIRPFFDVAPVRIKMGYQGDYFGLEFHALTEQKDPTNATSTNNIDYLLDFTLKNSYGAYFRMQQSWAYARVGATWIDTTLKVTGPNGIPDTDADMVTALTFGIGAEYSVTKNLSINFDYMYAEGKIRYPKFTEKGPGLTDPTLRLKGVGLGLNLKF